MSYELNMVLNELIAHTKITFKNEQDRKQYFKSMSKMDYKVLIIPLVERDRRTHSERALARKYRVTRSCIQNIMKNKLERTTNQTVT